MQGGSYVKQKDGTLKREEFTAPAADRKARPKGAAKESSNARAGSFGSAGAARQPAEPARSGAFDHDGDGKPGGKLPFDNRGLDDLKAEAVRLGITVDKRWGDERLRQEIAAVRNKPKES
ncbi:MAG: hypothetical protein WD871_01835 [Xanthobacteraceae bacterium]